MSKFNLPIDITKKIFSSKEELDEFNTIRKQFKEDAINILSDLEICEELYLNLNPEKFRDKKFRIKLLRGSFGKKYFNNFVLKLNVKPLSKNSTDSEKEKFVNKIATFKWEKSL